MKYACKYFYYYGTQSMPSNWITIEADSRKDAFKKLEAYLETLASDIAGITIMEEAR